MSTAYYPQGMRTMPAGGLKNASLPSQYVSWKGTGVFSNPIGIAPSNIRPLTNLDSGNVFLSGNFESRVFGKGRRFIPRPIKHYRKGRVIPSQPIRPVNPESNENRMEVDLINYNMERYVKSSECQSNLSGGAGGGGGLIGALFEKPGGFIVKENKVTELSNEIKLNKDCKTCKGTGIIVNYSPNNAYLTNNPQARSQTPKFCCNEEYKAKRRVVSANTNLPRWYNNSNKQYLQNRCKTFTQKSFNFKDPDPIVVRNFLDNTSVTLSEVELAKPGSSLATFNTYRANCYCNSQFFESSQLMLSQKMLQLLWQNDCISEETYNNFLNIKSLNLNNVDNLINSLEGQAKEKSVVIFNRFLNDPYNGLPSKGSVNLKGCELTVYKPSNPQFAKEGAVQSSTRLLKLNVDTISTNTASLYKGLNPNPVYYHNWGDQLVSANQLTRGDVPQYSNYLKNKAQARCTAPSPALIAGVYVYQNKKSCGLGKEMQVYRTPISQPSPYRYYEKPVFTSNHFNQLPRTYNNPSQKIKNSRTLLSSA